MSATATEEEKRIVAHYCEISGRKISATAPRLALMRHAIERMGYNGGELIHMITWFWFAEDDTAKWYRDNNRLDLETLFRKKHLSRRVEQSREWGTVRSSVPVVDSTAGSNLDVHWEPRGVPLVDENGTILIERFNPDNPTHARRADANARELPAQSGLFGDDET